MKQEHSFSLVYCPWIYVTDKTYKTNYVGLKQLFEEAEDYISITSENELITLSIHMLVFSIIFTVCNRNEPLYALSTHTFDYKKVKPYILSYLNTNANKFDLYDKEHPFLQLTKDNKNFKSVKPNNIQSLNITDQSNNKENKYSIDKINKNDIDGWIARHFISFRYFHCHVNKQKPDIDTHVFDCLVSKTLNSENKEITKKYFPCFYKGESISQTFKLNFLNTWYDNCSPYNRVTLLPDWEYDYSDFDKEKAYKEIKENKNLNKNLTIKIPSLLTIGSISPFVFGNQFSGCPQIVDGFQRYSALIEFIRDEQFSLVGLQYIPAFENKKFSELPRNIQRRFKMVCVKVYVVMPDTLPEYYLDVCRTINPNIA